LIGVNEEILESVKNIFYVAGFKTNKKNIWENFLNFSDGIPGIFLNDSHDFINVLSITVPNLKNWKEVIKIKNIKEKKLYLPKRKKTIFLPKNKSENNFLKKLKNFFNPQTTPKKEKIKPQKKLSKKIEKKNVNLIKDLGLKKITKIKKNKK
jgi:hypothetical protein